MKKTIFAVLFATMFGMALVSCGNSASTPATEAEVVETVVDSVAATDSLAVEALEADVVEVEDSTVVAE